MPPLFSIVTVNLNSGEDLRKTYESVAAQTFLDYEYIIKDGGSTDGGLDFLQSLRGEALAQNVQVVVQKDTGIYSAMNQALESCTGKYVLFLNAGDLLGSDSVLELLAPYCSGEDSSGLVYTDFYFTDQKLLTRSPPRVTEQYLFRTMLCHQVCFVKRTYYDQIGRFDLQWSVLADYDFLARLLLNAKASACYVPIASILYKGGGYSFLRFDQAREEAVKIRNQYIPGHRRAMYGLAYALTLPQLRIQIYRNPSLQALRAPYVKLVNTYYRFSSQRRDRPKRVP